MINDDQYPMGEYPDLPKGFQRPPPMFAVKPQATEFLQTLRKHLRSISTTPGNQE